MLAQGLKFFTDVPMTVVGMMLFFTVFIMMSSWTFFRAGSKEYYQKLSNHPFLED